MKKFICVLACLLSCFQLAFSQEVVLDFECEQESKRLAKETFSISNLENNDLAIFVKEKKTIQAYLFDASFNEKVHFSFDSDKRNKYDKVLGTKVVGNQYSLVYSSSNRNKYCVFTVDFSTKKYSVKEFKVDLPREALIKAINYKNTIYFLSSNADNEIIIRELDDAYHLNVIKTHALDLERSQRLSDLDYFSFDDLFSKGESQVFEIVNTVPNSIELVSEDAKIYRNDDSLYLTFDYKRTKSTLMIVISLIDFNIQRKEFAYAIGKIGDYKRYNSYFLDGKLFQIASSNKEMSLRVKSMTDSVLKSFYYHKEAPIAIRNSIITQDGNTAVPWVTTRTFDETSKFLRKISSGGIGVSAYKVGPLYHLTIGGTKEVRTSTPMVMPGMAGVTIASLGSVAITINPVAYSFSGYESSKSTYFRTTLDAGFNHVPGATEENIFEKIKAYSALTEYCSNEDVFYHNNELLFGYLNQKEGRYKLVKF
ncbi:hypothetical protein [Tamlana sp. I1]|uniref:hypothetical protein n=1 Tax=Tamlana sp. I1 TaxID=2762061 RepID=UPI001890A4F7|nr:hypothetical protein [Tamlana sp. I1]